MDVECEVLEEEEEEEEEKELDEEEDEDECIDEDDGDIDLFTAAAGSSGSEEHLIDDKESWNQCLVRVQHKYGEVLVVNEMADTKSSEASYRSCDNVVFSRRQRVESSEGGSPTLISHLSSSGFIVYDFCINSYYKFSTRLVPYYIVVVKNTNIIKITKIKIIICTVNSS